jgi:glycosyltransferase involved in cell wall biosynthesis
LTSDIPGIRENCGDAALLVEPTSVPAIADAIERLWCDDALRERLVVAGHRRVATYDQASFRSTLSDILSALAGRLDRDRAVGAAS